MDASVSSPHCRHCVGVAASAVGRGEPRAVLVEGGLLRAGKIRRADDGHRDEQQTRNGAHNGIRWNHFPPVEAMPSMKVRWARKKRTMTGSATKVEAAMS